MKKNVLFVDDDAFWAQLWIASLEETFDVFHFGAALPALEHLDSTNVISCVVLDVMMPTPTGVADSETANGFETGLWILRRIARRVKTQPLPVVILTNRDTDQIDESLADFRFDQGLVVVRHKTNTNRTQLRQTVRDLITRWNS